jgi:hypothetical protein
LQAPLAIGRAEFRVPEYSRLSALARFLVQTARSGLTQGDAVAVTGIDGASIRSEIDGLIKRKVLFEHEGSLGLADPLGATLAKRLLATQTAIIKSPPLIVEMFDTWCEWEDRLDPNLLVEADRSRLLPERVFRLGLQNPNDPLLVAAVVARHQDLPRSDFDEGHMELHFLDEGGSRTAFRRGVPWSELVLPAPGVRLTDGLLARSRPDESGDVVWFSRWIVPARVSFVTANGPAQQTIVLDRATGIVHAEEDVRQLLKTRPSSVPSGTLSLPDRYPAAQLKAALGDPRGVLLVPGATAITATELLQPVRLFARARLAKLRKGA